MLVEGTFSGEVRAPGVSLLPFANRRTQEWPAPGAGHSYNRMRSETR